jgi:hypothetical protein
MKNTLAENLLRFGVKNFTHENLYRVSQLLKEQYALPAAPAIDLAILRANADFSAAEDVAKTFMSRQKVLTTIPDAAAYLVLFQCRGYWLTAIKKNTRKGLAEFIKNSQGDTFTGNVQKLASAGEIPIQFNESPDSPGKVFMQGSMTATSYAASDVPNGAADINDIISYMNNYNILSVMNDGTDQALGFDIDPIAKNASFPSFKVDVKPGQPGYGAFLPEEGSLKGASWLYGLQSFKAASAQTTAVTKTEVTYTPGPELVSNLGKQLFKTGTITPEPILAQRIKEAVNAAKSLGTITAVRIESGASFDRPVNANNAQFAQMVGMPADKVPADPTKDIEGIVKDPMSGGNAFLAYYRGIALKDALGNEAGVTPTVIAKVQKGGTGATPEETEALRDGAQYAKLIFSVKKPDDSTTITTDDIKSIGTKSSSADLSGKFQCIKFDV